MVFKLGGGRGSVCNWFENDVKMYGIQTKVLVIMSMPVFENDVKMYGIQTIYHILRLFE